MKSTFKFNSLPIELRLNIWELALPGPRVIRIFPVDDGHGGACASTVIPVLLHINSESRQLALKYYELAFKDHLRNRPIYIDFQADALYLEGGVAITSFFAVAKSNPMTFERDLARHAERCKLRHLILCKRTPQREFDTDSGPLLLKSLRAFERLETLTMDSASFDCLSAPKSWVKRRFLRNFEEINIISFRELQAKVVRGNLWHDFFLSDEE